LLPEGWTASVGIRTCYLPYGESGDPYAAYPSREGAIKGSIAPGKLADFVVLADDLHTVNPDKIKDIQIVRTVVGGTTVYQA
jgi:predicted amidohydrolase YtcJ